MSSITCACCCKRVSQAARSVRYLGITGVWACPHCGAVQGQCYQGDSYKVCLPFWAPPEAEERDPVYFDLRTLGSDGIERRHGWFDPETHRLVQTG